MIAATVNGVDSIGSQLVASAVGCENSIIGPAAGDGAKDAEGAGDAQPCDMLRQSEAVAVFKLEERME